VPDGQGKQIIEAHVDDMVVKSSLAEDHVSHLKKVFERVRAYDMRLNPEKCSFEVGGDKFLGFMITHRVIKANPNKHEAITATRSPSCLREVQQLNGRLATLSHFLPKFDKAIVQVIERFRGFQL